MYGQQGLAWVWMYHGMRANRVGVDVLIVWSGLVSLWCDDIPPCLCLRDASGWFERHQGNGTAAAAVTAAAPQQQNVFYGDTTNFYSGEDGLHPFGYNHVGNIAPQVAALAAPLLL